ncbi:caspase family protein [Corticibacterium sp. UT-5YL-CI-8]|nr:caspase family protein [Tianweitania sp. UT-5YL-CI-8]
MALVLAADNYRALRPLKNAGNDGIAVKNALEALDFEVYLETDRDLRRMRRALDDFREDAKGADAALVFFSGHGMEIDGQNRLLPVDADPSTLESLSATSLPLEEVREAVAEAGKIGLILLDACRNDPFIGTGGGRSAVALNAAVAKAVKPGLGRMGKAENILYAFSAAPGGVASDGAGSNSPFTAALTKYLGTDGLEIRSVLTLAQQEVYDLSKGGQLPYVENGLPKLFFAGTTRDTLPERERLLLAMADVTPALRDEIEVLATERDMPLAPLYGALISSNASDMPAQERSAKLTDAADSFVKVRNDMRRLSSDDPKVTALRQEAEQQLSLGAFDAARGKLGEAAAIDSGSRELLKENLARRTLSEATTLYLRAGAARADLRYELAIADYGQASSLFGEVAERDKSDDDRAQHIAAAEAVGDLQVTLGQLEKAKQSFATMQAIAEVKAPVENAAQALSRMRVQSIIDEKIGDVSLAQGNLAAARGHYEASLEKREDLAERQPDVAFWHQLVAESRTKLGTINLSEGSLPEAAMHYQGGVAAAEKGLEIAEYSTPLLRARAVAKIGLGDVFIWQGQLPDAMRTYQDSLRSYETLDNGSARTRHDLSMALERIGDILVKQGKDDDALDYFGKELAIRRAITAEDPKNSIWLRELSVSLNKIGDALHNIGSYEKALQSFDEGLTIAKELTLKDPSNLGWKRDLLISYERVGYTRTALDDFVGAKEAYVPMNAIAREIVQRDPSSTIWKRDLASSLDKLGNVSWLQDDYSQALIAYEEALTIRKGLTAQDETNLEWQRDLSVSYNKIGDVRLDQKQFEAALESYMAGLQIRQNLIAKAPENVSFLEGVAVSVNNIGDAKEALKLYSEALAAYEVSLKIEEQLATLNPGDPQIQERISDIYMDIGKQYKSLDDRKAAHDAYASGLTIARKLVRDFPDRPSFQSHLFGVYIDMADLYGNRRGEKRLYIKRAIEVAEDIKNAGAYKDVFGGRDMIAPLREHLKDIEQSN